MRSFAIAALAAFASLATSAPLDGPIEKRANSGLEICVNTGFSGACAHLVNPFGDCGMLLPHKLPLPTHWRL